ncbi:WxL protein peptidoglycan domain-containing protein [Micromonospora sp. DT229]|uniref:WxL protein peptidoglycan domain-containing protein n=1 Tax=Micromonospora sp. DT229 TaxID=3393430 RepID=UPI003CE8D077
MPSATFLSRFRPAPDATASRARRSFVAVATRIGVPLGAALLALSIAPPAAAAPATPSPSAPGTTGSSAGQQVDRFSVQPSGPKGPTGRNHFIYDVAPGSVLFDYVGVTNLSDRPLTFQVYGTDAFTTVDGAFSLLPANQDPTDVGSWTRVEKKSVTVKPGKRADIRFEISVPTNATPGDHIGGVIAAVRQAGVTADGQQVQMDRRVAARVYLRVTGDVAPALTVESMDVEYQTPINPFGRNDMVVTYRLRNTGNVRLGGTGEVTVKGPFGWKLAQSEELALPELLPGSVFTVTERVTGVPPAVRLTAEVELTPAMADGSVLSSVRTGESIWAMPWLLLAALLVAGVTVYLRIRRRRAAAAQANPGEKSAASGGPAPSGEAAVSPSGEAAVPEQAAPSGEAQQQPAVSAQPTAATDQPAAR